MRTTPNPYRGFRFPAEIISHAVWLHHGFSLSLREVETILAQRGVVVSHESVRAWGLRFGRAFANGLKQRRPRPGDKGHLDEALIRIRGKRPYLWRVVDQHGRVLDILVRSRRGLRPWRAEPRRVLRRRSRSDATPPRRLPPAQRDSALLLPRAARRRSARAGGGG
jgi:putative transposase